MNRKIALIAATLIAGAPVSGAVAATPRSAQSPGEHISAARAEALHACAARESRYPDDSWGVQEIEIYRACMAQHGQAG
jgi:hypothetical protein